MINTHGILIQSRGCRHYDKATNTANKTTAESVDYKMAYTDNSNVLFLIAASC